MSPRPIERFLRLVRHSEGIARDGHHRGEMSCQIEAELCGRMSYQPRRCRATNVRDLGGQRVEVTGSAEDCRKGKGTVVAWTVIYEVKGGQTCRPSMVKVGEEVLLFDP